ncbi:hypothetical protein [Gordonia sp. SCSIO 19800]|uniref:hypothetical protein n=1 Tax=Gordonia sp. SCSIO 19800 TaxID=2826926 RepID=UPI001B834281|nr:hypothetical protein [Gordonia sp. SCSIO 19800]MBR7191744.1 hypothetical protein [Gordonia sp. SCSIO 19800]
MSEDAFDTSGLPPHLETTHTLAQRLNDGTNPVEAVVNAIAELESLIRIPSEAGDVSDGFVNTGAFEERLPGLPITQRITRAIERSPSDGADDLGVYALAALRRVGLLVNLSAAFEELIQGLEARVEHLEERS